MTVHLGRTVLLLLAALAATPAAAFVLESDESGGRLLHPRWPAAAFPVRFSPNDRPLELLPNLTQSSRPDAAIDAAMQAWARGPVAFARAAATGTTEAGRDGINLITFANTARNREVVGNFRAWTSTWWLREGSSLRIREADIVFNPAIPFATDGRGSARDLQDSLTHELGHALGLHHSPIGAATMYPDGAYGQTLARTLSSDDIAGERALYEGPTDPDLGALAGKVLSPSSVPIFGAHVVATDASGIVQVGALTEKDGSFSVPLLPPGEYQLYAEPLDRPVTPAQLPRHFAAAVTRFRTTFSGGNVAPAALRVAVGKSTTLDPIRVSPQPDRLNPAFIAWSSDGRSFRSSSNVPLQVEAGSSAFLVVAGPGLDQVADDGFSVSGSDLTLDTGRVVRGKTSIGYPYAILPLSSQEGAPVGARSLWVVEGSERAAFTGCLDVVSP